MKISPVAILSCALLTSALVGCRPRPQAPQPPLNAGSGNIVYTAEPTRPEADSAGTSSRSRKDVFVIEADGENRRVLAHVGGGVADPAWSSDGSLIAFATNSDQPGGVYIVGADGGHLRRITDGKTPVAAPRWSPDNKYIAYQSWDGKLSGWNIHVIDVDGKKDRKITSDPPTDAFPSWSPDGKQIVFHTQEKGDDWDVAVINADGTGEKILTAGPYMDWLPAFSPDGEKIAFWSRRTGNWEIFTVSPDGTFLEQISHENGRTDHCLSPPAWSPDGKYLAFNSSRKSGKIDLLVIDMTGRELQLADNLTNDYGPSWFGPDFSGPHQEAEVITIAPSATIRSKGAGN